MARKRASQRPGKRTGKATGKWKAVAKRKPAKRKPAKRKPARKKPAKRKPAKRKPARKKPARKRKLAKRKPRLTRASGGERAIPRKLADSDQQIETLRHHVSERCVSIASSIDTIPPEMIPAEMRDRWLRGLRQAAVALVPVIERLAGGPTTEA
jgi:hypothetical protein